MSVRAKFKVQSITRQTGSRYVQDDTGRGSYVTAEMQTIDLVPVYDPTPGSENHVFWSATPVGSIKLDTVNADAGNYFQLDKEYYIDFTQADPAVQIR